MKTRSARWFGTAALVAGLIVAVPAVASAGEDPWDPTVPGPKETPTQPPTCAPWEGMMTTLTAGIGVVTVQGTARRTDGSSGEGCTDQIPLVAVAGEQQADAKDWIRYDTVFTTVVTTGTESAFTEQVTVPRDTYAVCMDGPDGVLDCYRVFADGVGRNGERKRAVIGYRLNRPTHTTERDPGGPLPSCGFC